MEWIDSEAHGSLQTIREARVERVCSQEERACLMLSHGEESGRDSDEWREARGEDGPHCPVSLMRKRGCRTLLTREKKEDGKDRMRR